MSGRAAPAAAALRAGAATDAGPARGRNEDRFLVDAQAGAFAVIDGVGGHAAGETAAELALHAIAGRLRRRTGTPEERLREAIALANEEIRRAAERRAEWRGMGCVLTAAVVEDGVLTVAHVGDSRLYLLRGTTLLKLTRDHSPVGEREDAGEVGELDAMRHPRRNEVYRTVGSERHGPEDAGFIDVVRESFGPDDAVLLCTDGLTDAVTSKQIAELVARHGADLQRLAERLVEVAIGAGGTDNVTVVVAAGASFAAPVASRREVGDRALPPATAPPRSLARRVAPGLLFLLGVATALLVPWPLGSDRLGARPPSPGNATPPATHAAITIRVGPGGFTTISEALGAARPGDTVLLASGRWAEAVRLPEGVTLRAELPRTATVAPPRESALPAVAIVAEKLRSGRVAGIRIEPGGGGLDTGILVRDSSVEIDDCEIVGASLAAIEIAGPGATAVRSSDVHDNPGYGILIGPSATPRLVGNRIANNARGALEGLARGDRARVFADNRIETGGR